MTTLWNLAGRSAQREDREIQLQRWVQAESDLRRERSALLGHEDSERPHVRISL